MLIIVIVSSSCDFLIQFLIKFNVDLDYNCYCLLATNFFLNQIATSSYWKLRKLEGSGMGNDNMYSFLSSAGETLGTIRPS